MTILLSPIYRVNKILHEPKSEQPDKTTDKQRLTDLHLCSLPHGLLEQRATLLRHHNCEPVHRVEADLKCSPREYLPAVSAPLDSLNSYRTASDADACSSVRQECIPPRESPHAAPVLLQSPSGRNSNHPQRSSMCTGPCPSVRDRRQTTSSRPPRSGPSRQWCRSPLRRWRSAASGSRPGPPSCQSALRAGMASTRARRRTDGRP